MNWAGLAVVLRMAADGEQCDVVIGAAEEDPVEQPVAELVDGYVGQFGEHAGEPGEPGSMSPRPCSTSPSVTSSTVSPGCRVAS